jgi:hypothetical protein
MGEAAGVGAALALNADGDVRGVDIGALQARLARAGAFLAKPGEPVPDGV